MRFGEKSMLETEAILKEASGVKSYQGAHPPSFGLKAGAFADVGTIILTNRRFVYINKGGAARSAAYVLGGALAARAAEKNVSQAELDEAANNPGSYSIPLKDITRVETARHFGSSYLRIDNKGASLKPSYSFILGSGVSKNEDWVAAINSAITMHASSPTTNSAPSYDPALLNEPKPQPADSGNVPTLRVPVDTASSSLTVCSLCSTPSNLGAKFCGSCGAPLSPPKPVEVSKPKPKFCTNCGGPVSPNARFCELCGFKIAE